MTGSADEQLMKSGKKTILSEGEEAWTVRLQNTKDTERHTI